MRKITREVAIGNIKIGGNNPIAIQSMCNTDTRDIVKTVDQILIFAVSDFTDLISFVFSKAHFTYPEIHLYGNILMFCNNLRCFYGTLIGAGINALKSYLFPVESVPGIAGKFFPIWG